MRLPGQQARRVLLTGGLLALLGYGLLLMGGGLLTLVQLAMEAR